MENLNIAMAQADLFWKDKSSNYLKFEKWFETNREPVDLIILPEMFNTGFVTDPETVAENMNGETVNWIKKQAIQNKCAIMGSLIIEENNLYFNRLIWSDRNGNISYYNKRHLFTYGGEHEKFSRGEEKLIVELYGWKICPLVCYDLRFPVWAKNEYNNGNYTYDVLIYIANWPSLRSFAFRHLLIGRAIENQAYVVGVNRVGIDGKGLYYQGNSMALGFDGKVLEEIDPDKEAFQIVTLNYENLKQTRTNFPVGADWDKFKIL